MQQRVLIAAAISCVPLLLIADEPTTALDVTVQKQILRLLQDMRKKVGSVLYITHNLGIVAEICDNVNVMYLGKIVESGSVKEVFKEHKHPYTELLFGVIPRNVQRGDLSVPMESVGSSTDLPSGCRYHPRCPKAMQLCREEEPKLVTVGGEHMVSCHIFRDER